MPAFVRALSLSVAAVALAGCAVTVPTELRLADPGHRTIPERPGRDLDAMRLACAETMLNRSPAREASAVAVRVVSPRDKEPVVTEVDATLMHVALLNRNRPVSYRCEYADGTLQRGYWTRGLEAEAARQVQ